MRRDPVEYAALAIAGAAIGFVAAGAVLMIVVTALWLM